MHLKVADISLLEIRKNYPKLGSCLPFIASYTSVLLLIHAVNEERHFFWKEHEVLFGPHEQKIYDHHWVIKQIHVVQFITRPCTGHSAGEKYLCLVVRGFVMWWRYVLLLCQWFSTEVHWISHFVLKRFFIYSAYYCSLLCIAIICVSVFIFHIFFILSIFLNTKQINIKTQIHEFCLSTLFENEICKLGKNGGIICFKFKW